MKITQVSVFLENKKGRLYEATAVLGARGIDIKALTIAENEKFGVLRMIVDRPDEALAAFEAGGFVASMTEIIAVEVGDHPGGLAAVLKVFDEEGVNVEYLYAFVEKSVDKAIVVFRFDDTDKAIEVLRRHHIGIVGKKDIGSL